MGDNMRDSILAFLEKDSRLLPKDLAVMLGMDEAEVASEIEKMIDERVICGFNTLIDWEKAGREFVSALIEVKVAPQRDQGFDKMAERIEHFDEVKDVYLMSGGFDLAIMIEGKSIKDIAYFVSDKLAPLESVLSTATHFMLKKYKEHGVVIGQEAETDERMIVTP